MGTHVSRASALLNASPFDACNFTSSCYRLSENFQEFCQGHLVLDRRKRVPEKDRRVTGLWWGTDPAPRGWMMKQPRGWGGGVQRMRKGCCAPGGDNLKGQGQNLPVYWSLAPDPLPSTPRPYLCLSLPSELYGVGAASILSVTFRISPQAWGWGSQGGGN